MREMLQKDKKYLFLVGVLGGDLCKKEDQFYSIQRFESRLYWKIKLLQARITASNKYYKLELLKAINTAS